jgi:hypothetical protein
MSRHIILLAIMFALICFMGCKKDGEQTATPPDQGPAVSDVSPTDGGAVSATTDGTPAIPGAKGVTGATISGSPVWTTAVEPKPLSDQVKKGLVWIVKHQHENGGWAQGEESQQMGHGMDALKDKPNVADTCIATLALLRSGSTPSEGEYAAQIAKGVAFVCGEIEAADKESLFITSTRGTRVQAKLGQYVDTFIASLLLAEVRGRMADDESNKRVFNALDKVLDKIERHQEANGSWAQDGWAPTLATALANKGLNRAAQGGAKVDNVVRDRAAEKARLAFADEDYSEGSAGVGLYGKSANQAALQEAQNTDEIQRAEAEEVLKNSTDEKERQQAATEIKKIEENEKILDAATKDTVKQLSDQKFISGFGSNGGEEFLSYLNLSESLVVKGGEDWTKWDDSMTRNLNNIQNEDGSWTGHHCITGRTFCTSAALLVLMADRTPVPVAAKIKQNP